MDNPNVFVWVFSSSTHNSQTHVSCFGMSQNRQLCSGRLMVGRWTDARRKAAAGAWSWVHTRFTCAHTHTRCDNQLAETICAMMTMAPRRICTTATRRGHAHMHTTTGTHARSTFSAYENPSEHTQIHNRRHSRAHTNTTNATAHAHTHTQKTLRRHCTNTRKHGRQFWVWLHREPLERRAAETVGNPKTVCRGVRVRAERAHEIRLGLAPSGGCGGL